MPVQARHINLLARQQQRQEVQQQLHNYCTSFSGALQPHAPCCTALR